MPNPGYPPVAYPEQTGSTSHANLAAPPVARMRARWFPASCLALPARRSRAGGNGPREAVSGKTGRARFHRGGTGP
ncbi:hypothetical protein NCCP1664_29260 [Zafaria cholistanensis]|uniref:Uncharacterized protein n=1 Tax=Zafaria cholistanensis TaxID=1682741 RepID=A0A5A7NVY6_9MICC|nr:hypothetical protein NCCP1664_29260 [Zafaria cholistanensis]